MRHNPFRTHQILSTVAALFLVFGCGPSRPDFSTPQKTAAIFATALDTGNLELAKSTCLTTPDSERMIAALVPLSKAMRDLRESAKAKYGKDAGPLANGEDVATQVAKSKFNITGDTATLIPTTGSTKKPILMKKVEGDWKVDVKSMTNASDTTPDSLKNMEMLFTAMSSAARDSAAAITAGKYKNADEARMDVAVKIRTEMTKATMLRPPKTSDNTSVSPANPNGTASGPRGDGSGVTGATANSKKF